MPTTPARLHSVFPLLRDRVETHYRQVFTLAHLFGPYHPVEPVEPLLDARGAGTGYVLGWRPGGGGRVRAGRLALRDLPPSRGGRRRLGRGSAGWAPQL